MRQQKTRELHAYWSSRKTGPAAPRRRSLDPKDISRLLPDVFVLESVDGVWSFRLAGSGVCERHCMEMKGVPFREIWDPMDQPHVESAIGLVARDGHGCIITSNAVVREYAVEFETLFLPISEENGKIERIIGVQTGASRPWPIGATPIGPHSLMSVGILDGGREADVLAPRAAPADDGVTYRTVRHLRVFEGGLGA